MRKLMLTMMFFLGCQGDVVASLLPDGKITLDKSSPGGVIPADFVGLSYELSAVTQSTMGTNSALLSILSVLGTSGVVRFGGNTSDTYSPVTSRVVSAAQFVNALGPGWSAIFGLSCPLNTSGTAQAVTYANAFTSSAQLPISRVIFQIGNEPNFYKSTFTPFKGTSIPNYCGTPPPSGPCASAAGPLQAYLCNWSQIKSAVITAGTQANSSTPQLASARFAGADSATTMNAPDGYYSAFAQSYGAQTSLISEHLYSGCNDTDPVTSIPCSWTASLMPTTLSAIASNSYVAAAAVPLRVTESGTNAATGVGNTIGSALAMLWEMQLLVENGWSGINIHGGDTSTGNLGYWPVINNGDGTYSAQATLYSMVMFQNLQGGEVISRKGTLPSSVTDTEVLQSNGNYKVLLVNKSTDTAESISVCLPDLGLIKSATSLLLTASYFTDTAMTLGGSMIGSSGQYSPAEQTLSPILSCVRVNIPASSAVIVTVH